MIAKIRQSSCLRKISVVLEEIKVYVANIFMEIDQKRNLEYKNLCTRTHWWQNQKDEANLCVQRNFYFVQCTEQYKLLEEPEKSLSV